MHNNNTICIQNCIKIVIGIISIITCTRLSYKLHCMYYVVPY